MLKVILLIKYLIFSQFLNLKFNRSAAKPNDISFSFSCLTFWQKIILFIKVVTHGCSVNLSNLVIFFMF